MELLKSLYKISSPSLKEKQMRKFLTRECSKYGADVSVDNRGNIYVTKTEASTKVLQDTSTKVLKSKDKSYPCIVAHMDEVCPNRGKGYRVIEEDGVLFGFDFRKKIFQGIGGDDKNGIWVALRCLEKYDHIKVAFFVGEEVGCVGSSESDMEFFDDCRFVLQCDRRGANDLITSVCGVELCSEEFLASTNFREFGYKEKSGMLTDVYTLKERGLKISALNISCGYHDPHTEHEYTVFSELENALSFVMNIIDRCTDVYPHEDIGGYYSDYYSDFNSDYDFDWYSRWNRGYRDDGDDSEDVFDNSDLREYNRQYDMMEETIISVNVDLFTEKELEELVLYLGREYPLLSKEDIYECISFYRRV